MYVFSNVLFPIKGTVAFRVSSAEERSLDAEYSIHIYSGSDADQEKYPVADLKINRRRAPWKFNDRSLTFTPPPLRSVNMMW